MQQELPAASNPELWRLEDLLSPADLVAFNRSIASAGSLPGFVASAASIYNMDLRGSEDAASLDRALLASRNHREAERRRRERIKCHLDRLRHLLSCDPKIDKASLLAKAVEHVRELKQRASQIPDIDHLPTETDEIAVYHAGAVIMASVCCDDRSGLLSELVELLKSLRLRTLRAEMATLGGRVRSVLVVTRENCGEEAAAEGGGGSMEVIRDALRALVERSSSAAIEGRPKRRRMVDLETTAI